MLYRPLSVLSVTLVYCGQTVGWIKMALWHGGRPQPRRLFVRWGLAPSPKRGRVPQFLAHVCCGQTAAWIKMPLGTEVGLGLHDIVLDRDTAPLL